MLSRVGVGDLGSLPETYNDKLQTCKGAYETATSLRKIGYPVQRRHRVGAELRVGATRWRSSRLRRDGVPAILFGDEVERAALRRDGEMIVTTRARTRWPATHDNVKEGRWALVAEMPRANHRTAELEARASCARPPPEPATQTHGELAKSVMLGIENYSDPRASARRRPTADDYSRRTS